MFEIVAERICEMMVILLIGVAVYRLGIIDETASKRLSDLLLTVVAPPAVHPGHMAAAVMRLDSSQIS